MNYFVYVKGLLGLETTLSSFKWNFGSFAPQTSVQEFSKCLIKIKLNICKDKELLKIDEKKQTYYTFRHFKINAQQLSFQQRIGPIHFGYKISIDGNNIEVTVGKSYYHYVKYKIMNVFPIWYVIYDAVCCLLLKNNYAVLYGSAIEESPGKASILMGAPGVGKTLTAVTLCKDNKLKMIAEDLLITDGKKVWPVPFTNTYRGNCNRNDIIFVDNPVDIANLVVLEKGQKEKIQANENLQKKVKMLNRYNVSYYSSPAMIAYAYFNFEFSLDNFFKTEEQILDEMFHRVKRYSLYAEDSSAFAMEYQRIKEMKG